jgi:hypothetical protein
MICNDRACGCAISSETLVITGSGTPEDPWVVEQVEFTALTELENAVANLQAAMELLPGTYVDESGDTMTGPLIIAASGTSLIIRRTDADTPVIDFQTAAGASIGFLQAVSGGTGMGLGGRTGEIVRIIVNGSTEAMRWTTAAIGLLGKTTSAIASTGIELHPSGSVMSTRASVGQNFRSNKTSVADANGEVHFRVDSAGTQIGSITRATASTVAYNTSSDEQMKRSIEEIDDQLALYWMRIVQPMLFEYIRTPNAKFVGYIAQRVAAAWPESVELGIVTPGHGDINARTWDDEGNETTPDEVWRGWEIDLTKFVPFVHAGLQAVDVRLVLVEGLVGEQALKIEALEDEVADLREDLTALQAVVAVLSASLPPGMTPK